MSSFECRLIHNYSDFEKIVDLEILVWDLESRDAVPSSLMHAMATNGSLVVGAYDQDQLIGMALGFPARRGKKWMLWSHMAAVHPDYQGKGIGFLLKQFQRTWCLEQGYDTIGWTFDPLQRGNANFNLNHLGAVSQTYHINFYGEMRDGINAGLPSDRLEVHWHLRNKRVAKLAQGTKAKLLPSYQQIPTLLQISDNGTPRFNNEINPLVENYLVEIPSDLKQLKQKNPTLALEWRLALRQALTQSFELGYSATDFIEIDGRYFYVINRPEQWFLYVVECADSSLYTGITPNIAKRINSHNQGKGAAYTASRRPVRLLGAWQFENRSNAMKAEISFKKLNRQAKIRFIHQQMPYQNAPFFVDIDSFDTPS